MYNVFLFFSFTGGPKNYAYRTERGDTVCKIRGFTLNYKNSLILNFNAVKEMIEELEMTSSITVTNRNKITRDANRRKVLSKIETKMYCLVYDKRVIQSDYTTLPYGY